VTIKEQIATLETKIDTILGILGHGRTKSDAQIQREVEATVERLRLVAEQKKKRKKESYGDHR